MGKTPGKWIRTLLGKKSSKSNLSKGSAKLNSANEVASLVTLPVMVDPPLVSAPIPGTSSRDMVDSDKGMTVKLPNDHVSPLSSKENEDDQLNINSGSPEDSERTKHEQAARKVQATFRGHRARRAFKTLKGIIRLQAVIRGHLVRRQAVATLLCVWGIVKFQAIARGRKVRSSDVGNGIQRKYLGILQAGKCSETFGSSAYTEMQKLSKYAIVQKFLAPAPTALPLRLQYSPGEPNSAWEWLQRWTRLRFWEPSLQVNKNLGSKAKTKSGNYRTETQPGRRKLGARKISSVNVENSSNQSTSGKEKPKRYVRKVSEQPVDSAYDHPKNDAYKGKQHARRSTDLTKETSCDLFEVSNEKPKCSLRKASKSAASDISGKSASESAEKRKGLMVASAKQTDVDTDEKLEVSDNSLKELNDNHTVVSHTMEVNGKIGSIRGANTELSKDDSISNENSQASERRASLPAKMVDHQDNGLHSTRRVPSYMAPTESAKAKLRGQDSPRFSQDGFEKNGLTRRHSLPSSANGKFNSSSPRAVRLVPGSGKGLINSDRSLSSSRDGCDKTIRADWRR